MDINRKVDIQVDILIFKFEDPNKALFAVNLLLNNLLNKLPNTSLEEEETYKYWVSVKCELIKKHFK